MSGSCCGGSSIQKHRDRDRSNKKVLNVSDPFSKASPSTNKAASSLMEAKVVLLGDSGVGKSSIAQRFCRGIFSDAHDVTIGGAYLQQTVTLGQNGNGG
jgi:GTPase SAR1 family protein